MLDYSARDVGNLAFIVGALIDLYSADSTTLIPRLDSSIKLHCHVLGSMVTDEEIFEGLEESYKRCKEDPYNILAKVIVSIFFPALMRNGLNLTCGRNRIHFKRFVGAYPEPATHFTNDILYYFYHEKMG
jgi:hypothetical protein